jgi:hypothetical protein
VCGYGTPSVRCDEVHEKSAWCCVCVGWDMALEHVQPNYSINSPDLWPFRYIFMRLNWLDPLKWLICRRTMVNHITRAIKKKVRPPGFVKSNPSSVKSDRPVLQVPTTEAHCIENSL